MGEQLRLKIQNHDDAQKSIWQIGYNFETKSKLLEK